MRKELKCILSIWDLKRMITAIEDGRLNEINEVATTKTFIFEKDEKIKDLIHFYGGAI